MVSRRVRRALAQGYGTKIKFNPAGSGHWDEDKASPVARIADNGDGTYTLYSEDRTVEVYDASGFPLTVRDEHGVGWTFAWMANHYLTSVTHSSGRSFTLHWNGNVLGSVTDPAGYTHSYTYAVNKFGTGEHLLLSTVWPGTGGASTGGTPPTTVTYQYDNNDGALNGKSINGVRYSWLAYAAGGGKPLKPTTQMARTTSTSTTTPPRRR